MLGALGLLTLALLAYWPATQAGFVWDDDANVTGNLALRSADGLRAVWLEPGATTQYYPLVYTSFWIEHALWGLDPAGYHLDNVLLHALCGVLLWRLLLLMGLPGAWLAAAVFTLHPVHVESVAWVTERKNVLSGVFYLAAALVHLRHVSDAFDALAAGPARRRWGLCGSIGLFCAAILSKSPTATLPAALLLVIWWRKGRLGRRDILPLIPHVVLAVPIALLTSAMERDVGAFLGLEWHPSLLERALLAGRALFFYLGKLLLPLDLSFVYPRWDLDASQSWQLVFPLAALISIGGLFGLRHRIGRGPISAMLFFVGTLAPVLGFLEIYFFRFSFVADHWQYLASIGPITLLVCGAHRHATRIGGERGRVVAVVCAAGLLLTLGALCWQQTHAYSDSQALWRDSLAKNPRSAMVHYNLAVELEISGRSEEAREHYRWAIELEPDSASAYNNLGMMLAREQRPREAIELLREALRAAPDYARASWNLGLVLTQQGELDAALPHFRHALAQPLRFEEDRDQLIGSHVRLGTILLQHGRVKAARAELHRALALDADFVPAVFWLGEVALASDSPEHALRYFERVLSLEPGHRRALRQRRRALERIQAQRTEAPQGVARSPS